MSTLYPAMVNSPVTELSAEIDAAVTTITVLNGTALPDAPNIATIGQGDNAETILYAAKSGNTLSSVTRGFQGTARSWPQNSKMARNFTAYDYDTIRTKLDEGQTIPAPIQRGVNVVNSDQASGVTFKVMGCTLCNILGGDGGCESLTPFVATGGGSDELSSFNGLKSIKFIATSSNAQIRYKDYDYKLDASKNYILGCWVQVDAFTSGGASLSLRDKGTSTARYVANVNNAIVGIPQFIFVKIPTSNILVGDGFRLQFGPGSVGAMVVHYGAIRLFEVSAADYAAIGTTITGEAIDRRFPHVDSVKHLQGVSVMMPGKNLLPPFTRWTLHANAQVVEPYKLTLNATGNFQNSTVTIDTIAGHQYTLLVQALGTGARIAVTNSSGANIGNAVSGVPLTFTANSSRTTFTAQNQTTTGTFEFNNPLLALGDASNLPASFEQYAPRYAHAPVKLASNVDRTIADSYDSATGQVFRRWRTGIKVDGSFPLTVSSSYTGYKRITIPLTSLPGARAYGALNAIKYNGAIIKDGNSELGPDQWNIGASALWIALSNAETGWVDGISPNASSALALLNGWKANANTGSAYSGWESILDGSAPTTNNLGYVSSNKAPGWDAYATLDYVRATPITEQLSGDLGGLSVVNGGNTVELLEGVIVREKVKPALSSGVYYINWVNGASDSKTKYRNAAMLAVYKEIDRDNNWTIETLPVQSHGQQRAKINAADYDPDAEYFVDYIVLDKYAFTTNAVDATLTYQSTLGGAVAQATQDIARLQAQMGAHEWKLLLDEAYAANLRYDLDNHIADTAGAHAASAISATGGTTVQAEIDDLKFSVSDGKIVLAAAITDMGQAAAGSETFASLANKIRDISDDADADVGDVLAGKTFYQGGVKRTGTKPNRTGNVTGQSVSRSGTTLRIRPQPGNYPGDVGNSVQIADANFVAANIRDGVSLFGLTGTAIRAKNYSVIKPSGITQVVLTLDDVDLLTDVTVLYGANDGTGNDYFHNFTIGLLQDPRKNYRTRVHIQNGTVSLQSATVDVNLTAKTITISGLSSAEFNVQWWYVIPASF